MSASDRTLSAETRAAKMAGEDMRKVIDGFKAETKFMRPAASSSTDARRKLIFSSPVARDLLARGHTMDLAERVARLERDKE